MSETFTETLHAGYAQTMTLKGKMLVDEQSPFQNVKFFDTERNGRVLVLDGNVQTTTRDHAAYSDRALAFVADRAAVYGAGLVTTEKDWVRLPPEWRERVTAWPVRARFVDEAAAAALFANAVKASR